MSNDIMVKIVGIVASPRKESNTEFLVKAALENIEEKGFETELITLQDKKINFCIACDKCKKTHKCIINDDIQDITQKIKDADGLIFGSPVYFGDMTGLGKTLIDRLRPLRSIHALEYTVCGAISCGGSRNGGQETTIASIHDFFLVQGGIVVGDDIPSGHFGATGVGNTKEDENGITTAINLSNRVFNVIKKLKE